MLWTKYKGYMCVYVEDRNVWEARVMISEASTDEVVASGHSLAVVKSKIDKLIRRNFQRTTVWKNDCGQFVHVEITSITDDGQAWVMRNGRRNKEFRPTALFVDSEENRGKVEECKRLQEQIRELTAKNDEIISSMTRYSIPKEEEEEE